MMLGDVYATPTPLGIEDDGQTVDITGIDIAALIRSPTTGTTTGTTVDVVDATTGDVVVTPTEPVTLEEPGQWAIEVELTDADTVLHVAPAMLLVLPAEPAGGWATLPYARNEWRDAPADDFALWRLLDIARYQVTVYGPERVAEEIAAGGPVPSRYVKAQLMQARNIWNASKLDPSGMIGAEPGGFAFTPFPLDWQVRQTVRPKTGRPVMR